MKTFNKRKKCEVYLLFATVVLLLFMFTSTAGALHPFEGGEGTSESPYQVATAEQLDSLRDYLDKHFIQVTDIDLDDSPWNTAEGWEPIGTSTERFTGHFDGDGYTINNLFIDRPVADYVGLFGYTGSGSQLKNVGLQNVDVTGNCCVGGLVGEHYGSTISDSYTTGTVAGAGNYVGGLLGTSYGNVLHCYSKAAVNGQTATAGLVGLNYATISSSYAAGHVSGGASFVGGLVGYNNGTTTESYAVGSVTGTGSYVGGLVGYSPGFVNNSYARGVVTGSSYVGGLVGASFNIITNSYYDQETTGQTKGVGEGSGTGVSGLTSAEMKDYLSYVDWDFQDTWGINPAANNGYPFLRWQGYVHDPTAPEPTVYSVAFSVVGNHGTLAAEVDGTAIGSGDAVEEGKDIVFTAAPDSGYRVNKWTVNDDVQIGETGQEFTLYNLQEAVEVKVEFMAEVVVEYDLTLSVDGQGNTDPPAGVYTYPAGAVVSLTAYPAEGWAFAAWTGDATGASPEMTLTMDDHKLISAVFQEIGSMNPLWAWGGNSSGQLGDSTNTQSSLPARVGTGTSWEAVSAGWGHTAALKEDGSLWTWGLNSSGQLGDGSNTDSNEPVQVGSETEWVAVTAGNDHTVALKSDGSLWAWGANGSGQLGIGSNTNQNEPTRVGTANDWVLVSAGAEHTAALKENGTIWTWGANWSGQLGDDTRESKNAPTRAGQDWDGTSTGWATVTAGGYFNLALKEDGGLWAWGSNYYGQLGLGGAFNSYDWINRVGTATDWVSITAGDGFSLALKEDGSLWAWGDNYYGQLGDGTFYSIRSTPAQVDTATDWVAMAGGGNHTLALKEGGGLWAWGQNHNGQLGVGSTSFGSAPVLVGVTADCAALAAGTYHSLAVAVFAPAAEHNLTITVQGQGTVKADGTVVPLPYSADYPEGTQVELEAISDEGWEFQKWEIDGIDLYDALTSVTMDASRSVMAVFLPIGTGSINHVVLEIGEDMVVFTIGAYGSALAAGPGNETYDYMAAGGVPVVRAVGSGEKYIGIGAYGTAFAQEGNTAGAIAAAPAQDSDTVNTYLVFDGFDGDGKPILTPLYP